MKLSFGEAPKERIKRVLKALLIFASSEARGTGSHLSAKGLEVSASSKQTQLFVKATLKQLINLTQHHDLLAGKEDQEAIVPWQMEEVLEHLKLTLRIFKDLRQKRQGSKFWLFRLDLPYPAHEVQKNLEELELLWDRADKRLSHPPSQPVSQNVRILFQQQGSSGNATPAVNIPGIESLYADTIKRLFPTPQSYEPARQLFQVIAVAQEPLSAEQLADAVGLNVEDELTPLLLRLSAYLVVDGDGDGGKHYRFCDGSFQSWLEAGKATGSSFYSISIDRGHRVLAETCLRFLLLPNPIGYWQRYVERYTAFHLIQASMGEQLIHLLCQYPYLKYSVITTVVTEVAYKRAWPTGKMGKFLYQLADSEHWDAARSLVSVATKLMDSGFIDLSGQVAELFSPTHPYYQQIIQVLDLRQCILESHPEKALDLGGKLLAEKGIPNVVRGIAQISLGEGLQNLLKYKTSLNVYKEAAKTLSPATDLNYWMQAQVEISSIEILMGNLPSAWTRLGALEKCAITHVRKECLSKIKILQGRIYLDLELYLQASELFQEGLIIAQKYHDFSSVLEALNYLATTSLNLVSNKKPSTIEEYRELCKKKSLGKELGRSYVIEAQYAENIGTKAKSLELLKEAELFFDSNKDRLDIAKIQLMKAKIYSSLSQYDLVIYPAHLALQFFRESKICPLLRLAGYNLLTNAASCVGLEINYKNLDEPLNIVNLQYFPKAALHLSKDLKEKMYFVQTDQWLK